jgi:D-arabinose 1-dehydrogenase-like Zn-dependent alcohol dehydrogenase
MNPLKSIIVNVIVKPVNYSEFPLNEVTETYKKLEKGGIKGKVILRVENS